MANFLQIDGAGDDYCCIHNQSGAKAQDMAMMVNNLNRCYEDHIFPKYNKFDEQGTQHLAALSDGLDARSVLENELLAVNRLKLRRISEIMNSCRRIEGLDEDERSAGATQSYARSGDGGESEFCPEQSVAEDRVGSDRGGFGRSNSPGNDDESRQKRRESDVHVANDAGDEQEQTKSVKSPTKMPELEDGAAAAKQGEKGPKATSELENRSQGSEKSSDVCAGTPPKRNTKAAERSNSKEIPSDASKHVARKDRDNHGETSTAAGSAFTMDVSDEDIIQAVDIASNDEVAQAEKTGALFGEVGATTLQSQASRGQKFPGRDLPHPRNPASASFNTAPVGAKTRGRGKNLPGFSTSRRSSR